MLDSHFVILGAIINLIGSSAYIAYTFQGKVRPNRVSFLMWSLAPMVAFAAQISGGVGWPALMTFVSGFVPFLVLVASFANKKAAWELDGFDFACGFLSLLGLGLWLASGEGVVAIIFSILADGFAAIPTVTKSYTHPDSETWMGYFAGAINAGIALLTIDNWNFEAYGFALYILVICLLLTTIIRFRLGPRLMVSLNQKSHI